MHNECMHKYTYERTYMYIRVDVILHTLNIVVSLDCISENLTWLNFKTYVCTYTICVSC